MRVNNIRDFVPNVDSHLSDIELVDKYIHLFCGVTKTPIDLRCLNFSTSKYGSGSAGTLYKACTDNWYFKLSQFSEYAPEEYGYESVCEVIGSIVSSWLGFENVDYKICNALIRIGSREYNVYICVSENYKKPYEHRTTLENHLKLLKVDTLDLMSNFDVTKSEPFFGDLCRMLLLDYIVDNRDRHGANIELLIGNTVRLSPVYDTGYSLLSPLGYDLDRLRNFNPMHDGPVNNFLISKYWEDVLSSLKGHIEIPCVSPDALELDYLKDCFSKHGDILVKSMKSMIIRRFEYAKKILNT